MNDIILKLTQFGFSTYEAKAYLALLQKNPAIGYEVSKIAKIPTAKIYETLTSLKNKGAILSSSSEPVQYYPIDPKVLLQRIYKEFDEKMGKELWILLSNDWFMLNNLKIGIVGGGHLGQAIAHSLIVRGLERQNLLISYRDNPRTYEMLNAQGLTSCLSTNQEIFQKAGIILITIKPQDITGLINFPISEKALVVSCMAGVSAELLYQILGINVYRMMFSGPDTIVSEKGVATMYPEHEHLKMLLRCMNLTHIKTITEDNLDVFTAGVCMPAAILKAKNPGQQQEAIDKIGKEYPLFSELYLWAVKILPRFQNNIEKEEYVVRMITKGGITEAITNSLMAGDPLDIALQKGINQTQEISKGIQQSLTNHLHGMSGIKTN